MSTHRVAHMLEGLAAGLADGLAPAAKRDLEALARLLGSLPDQKVAQLAKTVETAVLGDPASAPALVRRLRRADAPPSEREALLRDLKKAKVPDLKQVYHEVVGVKPGALKKASLLDRILREVDATTPSDADERRDTATPAPDVDRQAVAKARQAFDKLRGRVREIPKEEFDQVLEPFHELPNDVLAALVQDMGYPPRSHDNVDYLRSALLHAKRTLRRTDQI